jgi:hypothetical protein
VRECGRRSSGKKVEATGPTLVDDIDAGAYQA